MVIDETIFGFKGDCPTKRTLPRKPGSHDTGILVYFLGGKYEGTNFPYMMDFNALIKGISFFFSFTPNPHKHVSLNFFPRA